MEHRYAFLLGAAQETQCISSTAPTIRRKLQYRCESCLKSELNGLNRTANTGHSGFCFAWTCIVPHMARY